MIHLGMHVDNWRHFDAPYEVPCQFASEHGLKYVEFGTIDGEYFVQALGYNPHIPLDSDPLSAGFHKFLCESLKFREQPCR